MAKKTITLQITGPDGATSEATSDLESIIVGSGPGAAVKLSDPDVSNLHCMLKVDKSGRLTVIDLGSDTGTLLKNRAVTGPMAVSSGETLVIGGSRLRVVYAEEPVVASGLTPPPLRAAPLRQARVPSPKLVPLAPRA
jgi:type II secretory pathway component HofQ